VRLHAPRADAGGTHVRGETGLVFLQHGNVAAEFGARAAVEGQPELRARTKAAVHAHGVVVAGAQKGRPALQRDQCVDRDIERVRPQGQLADLLVVVARGDQHVDFLCRSAAALEVGRALAAARRLQEGRLLPVVVDEAPGSIVAACGKRTQELRPVAGVRGERGGWLVFERKVGQLDEKCVPRRSLMRPQADEAQVFAARQARQGIGQGETNMLSLRRRCVE